MGSTLAWVTSFHKADLLLVCSINTSAAPHVVMGALQVSCQPLLTEHDLTAVDTHTLQATTELMAYMVEYTSGVICVGMEGADLDRLKLPLMVSSVENEEVSTTQCTCQ